VNTEQKDRIEKVTAWFFFVFGAVGLVTCFPAWLLNLISDRAMLGITLALSWLAILVPGFNAIVLNRHDGDG
jgi:hypothetical protein